MVPLTKSKHSILYNNKCFRALHTKLWEELAAVLKVLVGR